MSVPKLLCAILFAVPVFAQIQTGPNFCTVTSVTPHIRAEGATERVGDIVLQCSFGTLPFTISGNLALYLPTAVTNRINAASVAADAVLLADTGNGFAASGINGTINGSNITFYGLSIAVPASGKINLKVTGVRVNATQFGAGAPMPVYANISFSIPLNQSQVVVAYSQPSLYSTLSASVISCYGSPLPSTPTEAGFFAAGTALTSTRFTEAFPGAFAARGSGDDNGTRFIVRYNGVPTGTTLYLPDFVAGSDAAVPTSGGDLGLAQSGGQYTTGSGTLLLARVPQADSTGAGGAPMALTTAGTVTLNTTSPVALNNGTGYAVYEVVDSNPAAAEWAQFPTFVAVPANTAPGSATETVSYAPVASVFAASQTAPVPRFTANTPPSDCSMVGDCSSNYYPKLVVNPTVPFFTGSVTAGSGTVELPGLIFIDNAGGGLLNWSIAINYQNGSNWLQLDQSSGLGSATVRVWAKPQSLVAGTTYAATLSITAAGPLSQAVTIPVTVGANSAPATPTPAPIPTPVPTPAVVVSAVVNAASLISAPLAPGSLATLMGSNLSGKSVTATFDGNAATVLYNSATQINLQVPAALNALKGAASLVVTVDGVSSAPVSVTLAPQSPAVFANGVLNQDYAPNAPGAAAKGNSYLQIFATGIADVSQVTVTIGPQTGMAPAYAGAAPGVNGVEQVNVQAPAGLSGPAALSVCAVSAGKQYCSPNVTVYLQ